MAKFKFTTYAAMTTEQRQAIVQAYRDLRAVQPVPNFDPSHLAACAADAVFHIVSASRKGSNSLDSICVLISV